MMVRSWGGGQMPSSGFTGETTIQHLLGWLQGDKGPTCPYPNPGPKTSSASPQKLFVGLS